MIRNLFDLIDKLGGLSQLSAGQATEILGQVWTALSALWSAEGIEDYLDVTIDVLRPISKATSNQIDDGVLLALIALRNDQPFLDFLLGAVTSDIPATAMSLSTLPPDSQDLLKELEATGAVKAGFLDNFLQALPLIIEFIKAIYAAFNQD